MRHSGPVIGKEGHGACSPRPGGAETESEIGGQWGGLQGTVAGCCGRTQAWALRMARTHDGRNLVVGFRGWVHVLGTPGLRRSGRQLVLEGCWQRGVPALVVSGCAPSVSSHPGFLALCPSARGFGWRWHRPASGSRRGSSSDSQDSGFSLHEVAGLTWAALALCSTVPRVAKAVSPFGRLATLERPSYRVFGARGHLGCDFPFTPGRGTHLDPRAPVWGWRRHRVPQPSVPGPARCFHLPPGGALASPGGFALSLNRLLNS